MKKTILLVDDECASYTADLLKRMGYASVFYEQGKQAIREVNEGLYYDLALIDLSLPDIGGDEVIHVLKKKNPKIPVISFSGYANKSPLANAHFTKPIISREKERQLKNTIDLLLSREEREH